MGQTNRRVGFSIAIAVVLALAALLPAAVPARAQERELIAVLELDAAGTTPVQAGAVTDRLREEMLRSGAFTLVDRSQLEAVLNEQALQQTGCTSQECAVQVGRILGIRRIVAGKVTRISDTLWQLSTLMVDVETAETLRAETVIHEGGFVELLRGGVTEMGRRLAGNAAPPPAARGAQTTALAVDVPDEAEVFLNGERKGQGAQRFDGLVPGAYEVEVRRPGSRTFKQTVFVTPGQVVELKPNIQALKLAVLPIRRSGRWRQPVEDTQGWVTNAVTRAAITAGFDITHSAHVSSGRYPSKWGTDLSQRSELAKDTWGLFSGIDEAFVLAQGRLLGVDAVLAFSIAASGTDNGSWVAYLVDTQSGAVTEHGANWPYGSGSSSAVWTELAPMLRTYVANK